VTLFLDGVLANTQSVPQFDGAITGSGDNLTVVSGESDGENVLGVTNESSGGVTRGEIPKSEGTVP